MVQLQLCTLEHLKNSSFGRPFPRHGLQLLFWFANHCVTFEHINFVIVMKLVSDCQPERGVYGFHLFGNIEGLLPVLSRSKKGMSKKMVYFEVGNLNTETYPGSANLPIYVRENYGLDGNYNIDRIIISYHVRTRVVETVYVTEHDTAVHGRFSPDRTYEISCELIRAMQNPQLDLTTFITQMGYYADLEVVQASDIEIHYPQLSGQPMYDIMQIYSGSTATREQSDNFRFFTEAFDQQLNVNIEPFSYDQYGRYIVDASPHNSRLTAEVQHNYKKTQQAWWQSYWHDEWKQVYKGFTEKHKKRNGGGGISFFNISISILLGAGAVYLGAKCFSWLRSWWETDLNECALKMMDGWTTPSYQRTHIMLDYVF
ncbi:hypothetical protein PAMA_015815 [Pampus argenteus]